ncbi:MAG TPA: SusD/RagB family nutrient-binding outer membrane lipoprotein, partial [Cytophagales bacterium]
NTVVLSADLPQVFMDYAEVCFILSEYYGFRDDWYKKGVAASLEYWNNLSVGFNKEDYSADISDYLAKLPPANAENVYTQKYIAYFLQGYEAWSLIRRTGYPKTIVRPGEVNYQGADGTKYTFEPLVGNDIPNRLTYPVSEQTLNPNNYGAARAAIGNDALNTRVWWDVQ